MLTLEEYKRLHLRTKSCHPTERANKSTENELILHRQPKRPLVTLRNTAGGDCAESGQNTFVVNHVRAQWSRDADGHAKVMRTGLPLVTDFSGTVHSFTSAQLPSAIVDCLSFEARPRKEDMWRSYICVSRVTSANGLLLAQPFAPMLFRQGPLIGPTLMMQYLRGDIDDAAVRQAWKRNEDGKNKVEVGLKTAAWECGCCEKEKTAEHLH